MAVISDFSQNHYFSNVQGKLQSSPPSSDRLNGGEKCLIRDLVGLKGYVQKSEHQFKECKKSREQFNSANLLRMTILSRVS